MGAAASCLKALRAAYTWGMGKGYRGRDAVRKVKNTHRQKGGAKPWSGEDEEKFLNAMGRAPWRVAGFCSLRTQQGGSETCIALVHRMSLRAPALTKR